MTTLAALDAQIASAINVARAQRGLPELRVSRPLTAAAAFHSSDMVRHGFFSHDSSNGASAEARLERFYPVAGGGRWRIGETLLWETGEPHAGTVVREWLSSPEHRAVLFTAGFRELGISAIHTSAFRGYAATVVTADFGARR